MPGQFSAGVGVAGGRGRRKDKATGNGVTGGHSRWRRGRWERQERRRRKRRRGRPRSAKDGQMRQVPKGVATNGRQSYGACVRRTEASCYVRDKRRETKQLYALAAVGAKRTQQSPRAYPQRPRRWRTNMIQTQPHLSRARANAVTDLTGFHGLTGFGSESSRPPTGLHRTAKSCPKAAP